MYNIGLRHLKQHNGKQLRKIMLNRSLAKHISYYREEISSRKKKKLDERKQTHSIVKSPFLYNY
jgi:hypothetical protein